MQLHLKSIVNRKGCECALEEKYRILKEYFGHDSFRGGQEEIIDALCAQRDVVCVMPTGAGKSMCYQIPALISGGAALVISPLISLMHDQVMALIQSGVKAAYINSSLSPSQSDKVMERMRQGCYKLIYAAPERLSSERFRAACAESDISLVAVDEAHCVSQWGQDFRPSYLDIEGFISSLPKRPVVGAFTATATENVRGDIVRLLGLRDPFCVTTGFDRPNLFFSVMSPTDKTGTLLSLLRDRRGRCGIVYCSTRLAVENVCALLCNKGFDAVRYHAGMTEDERKRSQDDFVYDRASVMVATNAFGMGIDKSNVSFVIHYNMPKDLESYYQEAGRAGRDGSEAECILLYQPKDVRTAKFLIEHSEPNEQLSEREQRELRLRDETRLKYMTIYSTTNDCLRAFLLRYFGENQTGSCGKCSNCLLHYELMDITVDAQKILSCVVRMRERFGSKMVCDVLRGANSERVRSLGFDKLSTYGIMKERSESEVRSRINSLITQGYLEQTDSDRPILRLTKSSGAVLRGEERIETRVLKEPPSKKGKSDGAPADSALYERLRALRLELAKKASVPAYVVFTDAALREMCRSLPTTEEELSAVNGVGRVKIDRYGKAFLDEIRAELSQRKQGETSGE